MTKPPRLGLPDVVPLDSVPTRVQIVEVGPRDGLQNEKSPIADGGQAGVHPSAGRGGPAPSSSRPASSTRAWVPQLADADEVFPAIARRPGVRYPVLVPNLLVFVGALAAGVEEIAVFGSATETFARRNLAQTLERPVRDVRSGRDGGPGARDAGARLPVDVLRRPVGGTSADRAGGVGGVALVGPRMRPRYASGTPSAWAPPARSPRCSPRSRRPESGPDRLGVHFHDTYGQALANTLAALRRGSTIVDASAGGLGGCPYAKSATGNLATEDLVWLLTGLGHRARRRPGRPGRDQRLDGRRAGPAQPVRRGAGARRDCRLTALDGGCTTPRAGTREAGGNAREISPNRGRCPRFGPLVTVGV